jgi:hypothetical protein
MGFSYTRSSDARVQPTGEELAVRGRHDEGQVTIFVVLALAIFLLGFIGFAVDMTNLWMHRQTAQAAADAACQAGIMNVLAPTATQGFTAGTDFDCAIASGASPCQYAALNGYGGAGLLPGTESSRVYVTFPGSVGGYNPPPNNIAPWPYLRVDVVDRVKLTFSALITRQPTADVRAFAVCGLQLAKAPIPVIILHTTCPHALQDSGSAKLTIVGGPNKSIQVNSANQTCAAATRNAGCPTGTVGGCPAPSNASIDLCLGGPLFTGSTMGVFGAPGQPVSGFYTGSTGTYMSPATPIPDPYSLTPAPTRPGLPTPPPVDPNVSPSYTPTCPVPGRAPCRVPYQAWGCPDHSGCWEYTPGLYTQPINVKNETAIFDPGVFYIEPTSYTNANGGIANCGEPGTGCLAKPTGQCRYDFSVDSNGVVRPSTAPGDGSGGTMFYWSGPGTGAEPFGSSYFGGNAGNYGGRTVDPYTTANVLCSGGEPLPPQLNIPATVDGNVLMGQCTSGGNYYPYDSLGPVRGLLFFQDRRNAYLNGQASMQGGGGLVLSGSLYYHNCRNDNDSGTGCADPPGGYNAFLQLQGTPSGGTYVLGNITADELNLAGDSPIAMQLNPNAVYYILKATLLR